MKSIIGIDPGSSTGIACIRNGKLVWMLTIGPLDICESISAEFADRVVFEDSRLTSPVWSRGTNTAARMKIARNVGQVDAVCALIVHACERIGIPAHGISPKAKGAKLNAEQFKAVTGWAGRSNQHERDAAMVAWGYRGVV